LSKRFLLRNSFHSYPFHETFIVNVNLIAVMTLLLTSGLHCC